ncbi:hypothetical protein J5069_08650 [Candidatus Symbiopectobacterium sp. NZEC127]|uniref:hypothetical protein n=1 Tax=Candidatus Symbiopectobacterium sp. NZEC127 TaxID=2820472 RepID=UPI002226D9C0|nr:hypothetical protein [Candidatus Symbiopectobacterium sp. NZEC127]MCW2485963.1 hypothetical protein [Candidatus Symbiopectobacterium sp. NZEC127]
MLYVKEGGVLLKLDDWEQIYSRPNYVQDLDLKGKNLKALIGYYKNEPPRTCGIKSCHATHMKGGIVVTEDDLETCIGHICGSKIFKEKFDVLIQQIEKEVDFEIYKEAVATRKSRLFDYWRQAADLTSGTTGILRLAEKIALLRDPLSVGRFASMELIRMAANQNSKVAKEEWVQKEEKELTEEEKKDGKPKYKLEYLIVGQIRHVDLMLSSNDMKKLYQEEIEEVLRALQNLDLDKASKRQITSIGRAASAIEVRITRAKELKERAIEFLTRENLFPLYEKMLPMDTVSKNDLSLYENFINSLK